MKMGYNFFGGVCFFFNIMSFLLGLGIWMYGFVLVVKLDI